MCKRLRGGGGIKAQGAATEQNRLTGERAGVCRSAQALQLFLLRRKQENRAAKMHPLQHPDPLAEGKRRHGEIQSQGVISPGQGTPVVGRKKLQNSVLTLVPHKSVPARNLCCLILA